MWLIFYFRKAPTKKNFAWSCTLVCWLYLSKCLLFNFKWPLVRTRCGAVRRVEFETYHTSNSSGNLGHCFLGLVKFQRARTGPLVSFATHHSPPKDFLIDSHSFAHMFFKISYRPEGPLKVQRRYIEIVGMYFFLCAHRHQDNYDVPWKLRLIKNSWFDCFNFFNKNKSFFFFTH